MTKQQFEFIDKIRNHWFLRHLFSKDVLDFIACQFALESNYGISCLATVYNNYCGMKKPFKRVYYGLDHDGTFAKYDSLDKCIIDYCAWVFYTRPYQNALNNLHSFEIFIRNAGYCPEKDYISKINLIYSQLKSYENEYKN